MRHPDISPLFGICLQYYMVTLDQARGNRNPSYKQITMATTQQYQAFRRFTGELMGLSQALYKCFRDIQSVHEFHFHPYLVDWHAIIGQLPEVHTHFPRPLDNMLLRRIRNPQGRRPPWLRGRDS